MSRAGTVWGHSPIEDAECWFGACDTREEAIAEGRASYDGSDFWIQRGRRPASSEFMPSAKNLLESMQDAAADECGETAEDFPDVSESATLELDALLDTWCEKHVKVRFWVSDGEPEKIASAGT